MAQRSEDLGEAALLKAASLDQAGGFFVTKETMGSGTKRSSFHIWRMGDEVMAAKMRAKIYPFFWYAKEAEEAAKFYASIFPDSHVDAVVSLMSDSPSGAPGSVKVVDFTLFGRRF